MGVEDFSKTISSFESDNIKRKSVKLKDMDGCFAKSDGMNGESLVYEVFVKLFPPINMAMTTIESGSVNGEFYMTKGHTHEVESPELYFLLEGEGSLLIEKEGESKILELKKGGATLMPEGYAHRTINTGKGKLKFVTVFFDDSGRSYGYDFKKRILEDEN